MFKMKVRNTLLFLTAFFASSVLGAILGIDLGQDFTKAVLVGPGVPFEIVMSADSKRKDVSGIAFKPLGQKDEVERIYGSHTNSHCTRFPQLCALNYKPLLGKEAQDPAVVKYLTTHSGVEIVSSAKNRSTVAFNFSDHNYPIEELLAMNIQNIVSRASTILKEKSPGGYAQIDGCAIAVPSFFTQSQRNAIKDAVELSGLQVIALVDDGLAIAVNYATKTEFDIGKEYHIVYDMGAGSTAATLVSFKKVDDQTPVEVTVEGYSYDDSLGGAYFTKAVADIVKNKFLGAHSKISASKLETNPRAIAKIYQAAEKAKLILSANNEATVSIESLVDEIDFKAKVSRQEFEDYIGDVASRITAPITNAIKNQFDSSITFSDIKSVIYAGGGTRVPFVQQHLLSLVSEDQVSKTINADEAAVLGTTLRGIQISKAFKAKEFNVTEHSIFDYKIQINEVPETIFAVGTNYGVSKELDFTDTIIKNNKLSFDLIENTHPYSSHESPSLEDMKSKFTFNETNCTSVKYLGSFSLSESRIFNFDKLEAICYNETDSEESKEGFLDKFKLKPKAGTDAKVLKKTTISVKTKYLTSRPLGMSSKLDLRSHLQSLNSKDQQRKLLNEKLNELESTLYSARSFLDQEDIITKGPATVLKETTKVVGEYLEWLDYESDGARLKDVKAKIEKVKKLVKQIKVYVDQADVPLDVEEFKKLHQLGVTSANSIQEALLVAGEESLALAKKFGEVGLDYDKEITKLTKLARDFSPKKFEAISESLTKTFEKVKEFYLAEEEDVEGYTRETLFALREEAIQRLDEVKKTEAQLKKVHAQRMKELNSALSRFNKAQKRAAEKAAAKAKAEAELEAEKEKEEKVEVEQLKEAEAAESVAGSKEPVVEKQGSKVDEQEEGKVEGEQKIEHDEL